MFAATLYCIYRMERSKNTEGILFIDSGTIPIMVLFSIISVVHILQFIAVNFQLFVSKEFRQSRSVCLANFQAVFVLVLPALILIVQFIWLFFESKRNWDSIYYKWMIADVSLNLIGSLAYLMQLERIFF